VVAEWDRGSAARADPFGPALVRLVLLLESLLEVFDQLLRGQFLKRALVHAEQPRQLSRVLQPDLQHRACQLIQLEPPGIGHLRPLELMGEDLIE
jgi:hypothetical protein